MNTAPSSTLPIRSAFIASLVSVLLVLGSVIHAPIAATAVESDAQVSTGSIDWGFKESFRNYVSRDGGPTGTEGIELLDGTTRNEDGTFRFPLKSGQYDAQSGETELQFGGAVHFTDHESTDGSWLLEIYLRNPRIVIAAGEQSLYADVDSREIKYGGTAGAMRHLGEVKLAGLDIESAAVDVTEQTTSWQGIRAFGTSVLTDAFGSAYGEGTVLDNVQFSYDGPGGKLDLGDPKWATPGTPELTEGDSAAFTGAQARPSSAYYDEARGILYVLSNSRMYAVDADTMKVLNSQPENSHQGSGQGGTFSANLRGFDPSRGWVFTVGTTNRQGGGEIHATRWNADTGTFQVEVVDTPAELLPTVKGELSRGLVWIAWDSANDRLIALLRNNATNNPEITKRFRIATWTRSAGGWDEQSFTIEQPTVTDQTWADGGGITLSGYTGWLGNSGFASNGPMEAVVVDDSGSVIVPRWAVNGYGSENSEPGALRITIADGKVITQEISGTGQYRTIFRASDGRVWMQKQIEVPQTYSLLELRPTDGTYAPTGRSIDYLANAGPYTVAVDPSDGMWYGSTSRGEVAAYSDTNELAALPVQNIKMVLAAGTNRAFVLTQLSTDAEIVRIDRAGASPTITQQPQSQTIQLGDTTQTKTVTFTARASGTPEPAVQWQSKAAGESRFTNVAGATTSALTLPVSLANNGTQYRAVFTNSAGEIATEVAELTILSAPEVIVDLQDQSAKIGGEAQFFVVPAGNPYPDIEWESAQNGDWAPIAAANVKAEGATLTLTDITADQDGMQIRAKLTNSVGTVYSSTAELAVVDAPAQPTTYTGVAFEWTGASEWQHQPPNGSTANYLSAGVSDGTEQAYSATADGVEILQRDASGKSTQASWSTRGQHIERGGTAVQVVRLTDGTAVVQRDGSAKIEWPTSFSVNFYDGLVPFTMSNLVLEIATSGTGTLVADVEGYAGEIDNPTRPKEKVQPQEDVVVATFKNVVVDTENGFTIKPDFAGVQITTPIEAAAQNRSVQGWGSWPQGFVDFQQTTGLAGYFYTTGGTLDPNKASNAFAIGFEGATPEVPVEPPTKPETPNKPAPPPTITSVAGSMVWGVKASFRSYVTGNIAKGAISVSGGATTRGGAFWFGQTSTDWKADTGTGSTSYGGSVRFTGHSGVLDLTFSNPVVRIDSATSGALLVTVNGRQVEIGSLNLGAASKFASVGGVAFAGVPVTLTSAGAGVFSYGSSRFYEAGTSMDSLSFVVGATATSTPGGGGAKTVSAHQQTAWTPPAKAPANTGLYIDPEQLKDLHLGSEITATGEGFEPNETDIKVVLYSEPVVLDQHLTADASGKATWTGILPVDMPLGEHTLTFQGSSQNLGIDITVTEAEELVGCTVEDATLTWGFKETFRSYTSGTIAHGEWTVADGATYTTPEFGWSAGEGAFDSEAFTGKVSFRGSIRFTGHDGLLDTTVANPTIMFTGPAKAYLLLDVSGLTMEDALDGNTDNVLTFDQVSFVELDLAGGDVQVSDDGATITATTVPTKITSQGYEAFPNYEAGTEFDPISFQITTASDCAMAPEAESGAAPAAGPFTPDAMQGANLTWLWWTGGGLVAAGIIAAAAIWVVRRRKESGGTAEESLVDDLLGGGQ